jgi:hypothetical protein
MKNVAPEVVKIVAPEVPQMQVEIPAEVPKVVAPIALALPA